jgi:hypothetical protein
MTTAAQTTSNVLAGITLAGASMNWMDWVAANSVTLTVIIVAITGVGSLSISWWGKRCENKFARERNDILRESNRKV